MDRARVAAHPFLAGLPEDEIEAVARAASEREFSDGQTLMSEGDFGYCLFLIESGSADVMVGGAQVQAVGPGDLVGEVAVLAGKRSASVVATAPIRALAFFKRDVWALAEKAPGVGERLRAAIEGRHSTASPPP